MNPRFFWITLVLLLLASANAWAQDPNACDEPGDEPDVIVGSIYQMEKKGTVDDITAFSIGTISCNVGTCWLNWFAGDSNQHPVIAQNMFRLKEGRFEQIGQSWLKHGFQALALDTCSDDCITPPNGQHLGVNCSDPYSSFLNGIQDGMGPKFEVNPSSGFHPHPVTDQSLEGNAIFKRLQVHNDDLDPALNNGALYWVEAQYIAEDDAAAGNQDNNASYRPISVSGSNGNYNASLVDVTVQGDPAIRAWLKQDASVKDFQVSVPDDGVFLLAVKATDLGDGMWNYEYAVQNLNSHRSAMSFSVPVPENGTLDNIGFHDVDYHSGEPFDGEDWSHNGGAGGMLTWTTESFGANPDANALRWGTLYNFRFDSDAPPVSSQVTLGLFRPGFPDEAMVDALTPQLCDDDGFCDPGESCARCPDDCANNVCEPGETVCSCSPDCGDPATTETACGDGLDDDCDGLTDCDDADCCGDGACSFADADSDGFLSCEDCNDFDGQAWATPGEVTGLLHGPGKDLLTWVPPAQPGAPSVDYEVLRARSPDDFVLSTTCLAPVVPADTELEDNSTPLPGLIFTYLVRAVNGCPDGVGPLGSGTDAAERIGRTCP